MQQDPLVKTQTALASLRFLSSYSDRGASGYIFVFLVNKQLQLILWDFKLMNLIDLFIDLCWELATRLNEVFWHWKNVYYFRGAAHWLCLWVVQHRQHSLFSSLGIQCIKLKDILYKQCLFLWKRLLSNAPITLQGLNTKTCDNIILLQQLNLLLELEPLFYTARLTSHRGYYWLFYLLIL